MNSVEDLLSESERNEWSGGTVATVDDEVEASEADVSEVDSGSGIISDPSKVGVERLLSCDGVPIDAEIGDGVDDAREIFPSGLGASGCAGIRRRSSW